MSNMPLMMFVNALNNERPYYNLRLAFASGFLIGTGI